MFTWIKKIEESILKLLLVSLTLLVFLQVVDRFWFQTGLAWSHDAIKINSAWFVLIGASYGLKVGSHIGVDYFVNKMSAPWQRAATLSVLIAMLVYCLIFLAGSWHYISTLYEYQIEMDDLPIPKWVPLSILLYGFAALLLRLVIMLVACLRGQSITLIKTHDHLVVDDNKATTDR